MSAVVDIQKISDLEICKYGCDLTDCLKDKLYTLNIYTVGDLAKISKSELLKLFPATCADDCFLDYCIRDIEHLLGDLGLSFRQEIDENSPYKKVLVENEELKQENAFLKEVVKYFAKELIKDTGK